jgi:aspartyl-tRNA(Asn)/glutamyl-tRNA(Gln) amidotransferase subunit C
MISKHDVMRLAAFAKMTFNDQEIEKFTNQISSIQQMLTQISELNCNEEPLTSVCDMTLRMRDDVVTQSDIRHELLSNAPGADAELAKKVQCFIVPKVME